MNIFPFIIILVVFFPIKSHGQQMYSGNLVLDCNNNDETGPSPAFLYTCNGLKPSCPAFLMFRTQPLYNTVMTISKLMSVDHVGLARINNIIDSNKVLPLNKELIIPVTCSCLGEYYRANTSFVIPTIYDTYFTIANSTYEGLTTCNSLMRNNIYGQYDLHPGQRLQVPLRCACPTVNQTGEGTRYLFTYLITWKDSIKKISKRFKVSIQDLALANGFSFINEDVIYPFTTLVVPLSDEPLSSMTRTLGQKQNLSKKYIIIGTITGSFSAILCGLSVGYFLWKRNRSNSGKKVKWVLPKDIEIGIASVDKNFKVYRFDELEDASDGFSLQNRLSASVYKGDIKAKTVAIKQMGANVDKEVKILQKFNHFNLIRLYGVCQHDDACFLVYEFMENGSLNEWLEAKTLTCQESQSWTNRIRIGLDVAKGLQYLHNFASPAYVHKDINSSNILLSKDLRAKISKFGLARLTEKDQNGNSSIKCPLESKGYHAPEYIESGTVTTKTDVYAFGVVLLELITGKKAVYEDDDDGKEVMLSENVISFMSDEEHAKDKVNYLIDPRLQARHPLGFFIDHAELAFRLVKLGVACLEPEPSRRLSMNEIVSTLMMIQVDAQSSETMFTAV